MEEVRPLMELVREFMKTTKQEDIYTDAIIFGQKVDELDPEEVMSALHKEILRQDFNKAGYWAITLDRLKGRLFSIGYLFRLATVETNVPELKQHMAEALMEYKGSSLVNLLRCVEYFCRCTSWKYMTDIEDAVLRYDSYIIRDIDMHNQLGKRVLTPNDELVAKWTKKLPKSLHIKEKDLYWTPEIFAIIDEAIAEKNIKNLLYAIHVCSSWEKLHKYTKEFFIMPHTAGLHKTLEASLPKKNTVWSSDCELFALHKMELLKPNDFWLSGYGLSDFDLRDFIAEIHKEVATNGLRKLPNYAHDSETKRGRQIWAKSRDGVKPNEKCRVGDFRYGSNWISVMWRREAYKQHQSILVEWDAVVLDEKLFNRALWKDVYPFE